jgi:hypothetical protein
MSTATAARPTEIKNGHWYAPDGTPAYTVIAKGTGQPRPTTIADARKLGLLPSVTHIIDSVLRKPALEAWKIENGILAVLTTPRLPGEADDAFVHRVLHVEEVHNQEAAAARDKGTAIHAAMEQYFSGEGVIEEMKPWIEPAAKAILARGERVTSEKVLVGLGYAGRTDLVQESSESAMLWDFKSSRTLPDPKKGAWIEARLQLSAYAASYRKLLEKMGGEMAQKPIRVANCYISTIEPGNFVICEHEDWQRTFNSGFLPILKYWQWVNNYLTAQT